MQDNWNASAQSHVHTKPAQNISWLYRRYFLQKADSLTFGDDILVWKPIAFNDYSIHEVPTRSEHNW